MSNVDQKKVDAMTLVPKETPKQTQEEVAARKAYLDNKFEKPAQPRQDVDAQIRGAAAINDVRAKLASLSQKPNPSTVESNLNQVNQAPTPKDVPSKKESILDKARSKALSILNTEYSKYDTRGTQDLPSALRSKSNDTFFDILGTIGPVLAAGLIAAPALGVGGLTLAAAPLSVFGILGILGVGAATMGVMTYKSIRNKMLASKIEKNLT